jgi:hypothetical protein
MSKYQIYNGTDWVDLCNCKLNVLNQDNIWKKVDPNTCAVRFWTGTEWCLVQCILVCGGQLNITRDDSGVYYVPFTIPSGIESIKVTVSAYGNPDGFSIVTTDKLTKLASTGMVGTFGVLGWDTGVTLVKGVYLYQDGDFVDQATTETITFYGEDPSIGDPPGGTPMSNTNGDTMYNPGELNIPAGIAEPTPCSDLPGYINGTSYELNYTKTAAIGDSEDVLIQIVTGNFSGSGWSICNVECIEPAI